MKVQVSSKEITTQSSGALLVACYQKASDDSPGHPPGTKELDKALGGAITGLYGLGFKGGRGETRILAGPGKSVVVAVGVGKADDVDLEALRRAAGLGVRAARRLDVSRMASTLHLVETNDDDVQLADRAEAVVTGAILGGYKFDKFLSKTDDDDAKDGSIDTIVLHTHESGARAVRDATTAAVPIAEATATARDLANTPANIATPVWLANHARKLARTHGLKAKVIGEPEAKRMNMGGLLGVAQGSQQPPRLVVLEHKPKRSRGKPYKTVCLVGKGITFDTGGISIKPGAKMDEMKFDKCGAIAVMATLVACARLELPVHVVGIMAFAENMPSGTAYRPGDVLTMANGKTVEVLNTDAEGRLVLADALWYAHKYDPDAIVDAATLTGAIDVALGPPFAGLMGNDDELIVRLQRAGDRCGERMWPMPLGEPYQEMIKGTYGDIQNIGGRSGGALTAGQFLRNFVDEDEVKWAHIDIAATAWGDKDNGYTPKGASGFGVRAFTTFLRDLL